MKRGFILSLCAGLLILALSVFAIASHEYNSKIEQTINAPSRIEQYLTEPSRIEQILTLKSPI